MEEKTRNVWVYADCYQRLYDKLLKVSEDTIFGFDRLSDTDKEALYQEARKGIKGEKFSIKDYDYKAMNQDERDVFKNLVYMWDHFNQLTGEFSKIISEDAEMLLECLEKGVQYDGVFEIKENYRRNIVANSLRGIERRLNYVYTNTELNDEEYGLHSMLEYLGNSQVVKKYKIVTAEKSAFLSNEEMREIRLVYKQLYRSIADAVDCICRMIKDEPNDSEKMDVTLADYLGDQMGRTMRDFINTRFKIQANPYDYDLCLASDVALLEKCRNVYSRLADPFIEEGQWEEAHEFFKSLTKIVKDDETLNKIESYVPEYPEYGMIIYSLMYNSSRAIKYAKKFAEREE